MLLLRLVRVLQFATMGRYRKCLKYIDEHANALAPFLLVLASVFVVVPASRRYMLC